MTAQVVRRLYVYTAAFIGLQLVVVGARDLLSALLEQLFAPSSLTTPVQLTMRLSGSLALLLAGLPLWIVHWLMAQRSLSQPDEQYATLRRLYGYGVLLVALVMSLFALRNLFGATFNALVSTWSVEQISVATATLTICIPVQIYHWRIMRSDRAEVEQTGGPATLRRWYLVLALAISLGMIAVAAVDLIHQLLLQLVAPLVGDPVGIAWAVAGLAAGLIVWLPHQRWADLLIHSPSSLHEDERRSSLRQVYLALVITVTAISTLGGLTTLLYATLLAGLGGSAWASVLEEHTTALGLVVVASMLWSYHRRQLMLAADLSGAPERTLTAQRLIGYVTVTVGLVALFFGLGGLIGTILRMIAPSVAIGSDWRDQLSLYIALSLVALPVYSRTEWVWERRVQQEPDEERTLARRIYLYVALLFGLVATVVAAILLLRLLIGALLGAAEADLLPELGRWLGYTIIGTTVAISYGSLLRRSREARSIVGRGSTIVVVVPEPLRQALVAALARDVAGATVHAFDMAQTDQIANALATADSLIVPLSLMLDSPLSDTIRAFRGRRLVVVTPVAGYDLLVAQPRTATLARMAAHHLRQALSEAPRTAGVSTALAHGAHS